MGVGQGEVSCVLGFAVTLCSCGQDRGSRISLCVDRRRDVQRMFSKSPGLTDYKRLRVGGGSVLTTRDKDQVNDCVYVCYVRNELCQ